MRLSIISNLENWWKTMSVVLYVRESCYMNLLHNTEYWVFISSGLINETGRKSNISIQTMFHTSHTIVSYAKKLFSGFYLHEIKTLPKIRSTCFHNIFFSQLKYQIYFAYQKVHFFFHVFSDTKNSICTRFNYMCDILEHITKLCKKLHFKYL